MKLFHILAGLSLIGATGYSCFLPFVEDEFSEDRVKVTTMFVGLTLGFVLFTGFFQLGSRHSVPGYVINKLTATALGGGVTLLGLFLWMKDLVNRVLFLVFMGVGLVLFGMSLYWGLAL